MLCAGQTPRCEQVAGLADRFAWFGLWTGKLLYHSTGELRTITSLPWMPSLGIRYELAADGISLTLVLADRIAAVAGVLFSWNVEHRPKCFLCTITFA